MSIPWDNHSFKLPHTMTRVPLAKDQGLMYGLLAKFHFHYITMKVVIEVIGN